MITTITITDSDRRDLAKTINLLASVAEHVGPDNAGYADCVAALHHGHALVRSIDHSEPIAPDAIDMWVKESAAALDRANPLLDNEQVLSIPAPQSGPWIEAEQAS